MPWDTPTLKEVRSLVRDAIHGSLPGSDATVPNSVLRVLSDAQGALCFLTLEYIDWLALQLMPDTAETMWLDRHADIWLVNSDGTIGRKLATLAKGTVLVTGLVGSVVPAGSLFGQGSVNPTYQTTAKVILGSGPTEVPAQALVAGTVGNLEPESVMGFLVPPPGVDSTAIVVSMDGGAEQETDDELRMRVLLRIREPPMGGDADDYINWAMRMPGVTRAWCYPLEMGIGTVTVRFMMDDLRADNNGFPYSNDVFAMENYLNSVRPVAVKDFFVVAPLPFPINLTISNLITDNSDTRAAIEQSLKTMFLDSRVSPGQEIYASWISEAISETVGVDHFDLDFVNTPMPSNGYLAILGTIIYA